MKSRRRRNYPVPISNGFKTTPPHGSQNNPPPLGKPVHPPFRGPQAGDSESLRPDRYRVTRAGQIYKFRRPSRSRFPTIKIGCGFLLSLTFCLIFTTVLYVFVPGRTNILLMGIDYAEPGSYVARTDTLMLTTFSPRKPYISLLSIPRDLWVKIPGQGENRINTAHFYAESRKAGSGPEATIQTIETNFKTNIDYYLRIRFEGFREVVDALGGVDIRLTEPMAGYSAGKHHLTGRKALAFVRDRSNADDFFRMSHGQVMLRAIFSNMLNPLKWPRLPFVASKFLKATDTSIPFYMWPRLGLMLLFTGPNGIDYHLITRQMVTPYITDQGANVLLPKWDMIHLLVSEVFS